MDKNGSPLDARQLIRRAGLKCTQARCQVLELLLEQREVLSADDIYEKLLQAGASLNFPPCTGSWKASRKRS